MPGDAESVLDLAEAWSNEGREVAWATVISTWRSSPRPLGSQMAISDDGRFAGSVSGGCVEAAVIQEAAKVIESGTARTLSYGVSTETAWEVGLPCGGKIEVFLAPAPRELLARLAAAARSRVGAAYVVDLASGAQQLLADAQSPAGVPSELEREIRAHAARGETGVIERDGRRVFVHVVAAPPRLVVVGAVHLTQALGELAELAGYELVVVDPRTAFATIERFPRARLVHDWPDAALRALSPDRGTAVVVLSHDAKLDEPALDAALRSEAFYIGALGSRRTQESRRRRLAEAGFDERDLSRIHGPVGLDIGAITTPEIAIAIMAEIIRARRGPQRGE